MRNFTFSGLLFTFLCVCLALPPQANATSNDYPGTLIGEKQTVTFDLSASIGSAPAVKILDSDPDGLLIEFELPELTIQEIDVNGKSFHAIEINSGGFRGDVGDPMLPTFSKLIQLPDGVGYTINVENVEITELTGLRPIPMQPGEPGDFRYNESAYSLSGYDSTPATEAGAPAIARDLRVTPITFNPVKYDPAAGSVEVSTRITVRVDFAGSDDRNAAPRYHSIIPTSFHKLYKSVVLNYDGPREGQRLGYGSYVIICPNSGTVISKLQPLVDWRTRKGYNVYLATTAETGTSANAIKSWIQDKYNTWDNPPEHIVLVGDAGGSISIPCFYESYSSYNGETDHNYVQLAGGDILADAHIGRISVSTTSELELYVHKITSYEGNPYMASTNWYRRGTVTADTSPSGPTTIQCMQWLKTKLLAHNYTAVDTIFSGPFVSQMSSRLNQGNTAFCYRGYWGMSSFDTGQISNLQNGRMMPFAVILTCDTGSFASGFANSEAFMRGGLPPSTPTAGIASIGTATIGTHTRFNNCMTYGIWSSAFDEDNYEFGAMLTRGKYELFLNYGKHQLNNVGIFSSWNNLMGDPAGEMWTGVPQDLTVTHESDFALGANSAVLEVRDGVTPVAGAYACLWKDGETHVGGYTGYDGIVELPIDVTTAGDILVTVSKHNYKSYQARVDIDPVAKFVGYNNHTLSGDGNANPNEAIGMDVQVMNFGTDTASSVTGVITCDDAYVTISDNSEDFGTVSGGATAWCSDDFDLEIAGGAPNGHIIDIGLDTSSGADDWHSLIQLEVMAPEFSYSSRTIYGVGTLFDPGESGEISYLIRNIGALNGTSVTGTLTTTSNWLTITDDSGSWGNVNVNNSVENSVNRFGLSAASDCYPGHVALLLLVLEFNGGMKDSLNLELTIGTATSGDPTGPDAYGYYAYDNTDTSYLEAPTYNWIEIASNQGGPGTDMGLGDFGEGQDDSRTLDLPFAFTYYGESFTRTTVCSNGWMTMGHTYLTNYRNWQIPCAGAPPNLIAPMWDNFEQNGNDRVYHWFDATNHRYVVQWSRVVNMYGNGVSNFQVILYDPAYYPTETGDGIIDFQFNMYNNTDTLQHYSTTGIQNGDNTTGVLYSYWNDPNTGAAQIVSGRAIRFQPMSTYPRGTLSGHVANGSDGNSNLAGVTVRLVESGQTFVSTDTGNYGGMAATGTYTVEFTHPSFTSFTAEDVEIIEDETTVANATLLDILGPMFENTTILGSTDDTIGPYVVYTDVIEYSGLNELALYYNLGGAGWISTPLILQSGNQYMASIPGASYMTNVVYYLYGVDVADNEGSDPAGGAGDPYSFYILPALVDDEMEDGMGGWSHDIGSSGYTDQWHQSTERNHTPAGDTAWKFGDNSGGDYDHMTDGVLVSSPFALEGDATLTFWHWMQAETSSAYPGYAYDGGFVEMSIDGGGWSQIHPVGGYPYLVTVGSGPGPYAADTPLYSGGFDWTKATFLLEGIDGEVRIRFRFGTDGAVAQEGWFIDDVFVMPESPGLSAAPDDEIKPIRLSLYQNSPNPFSSGLSATRIRFDLPETGPVELKVYDTNGRLVNTLLDRQMGVGSHLVSWDGRDQYANPVGSGVYYYVLNSNGKQQSRQMLILK
jgi:Peptidase family C25/Propeptide_C25/FlgD Ig-like domain